MARFLLVLGVAVIAALSAAVGWAWVQNQRGDAQSLERVRALFRPVAPVPERRFSLVDQNGRPVTEASFRGRLVLLYFGYTYCPDICPTDLLLMAEALDLLGEAGGEVQPVLVTIDPARDTPEQLAGYVGLFHPRLVGLTGSPGQVADAVAAFGVAAQRRESARVSDYVMEHSSDIYLLDRNGAYIRAFRYGTTAAEIAAAVRQHL